MSDAREATKGKKTRGLRSPIYTVEWLTSPRTVLIAATVLLCTLGLLMVFSVTSVATFEKAFLKIGSLEGIGLGEVFGDFLHQVAYLVLGVVACAFIAKIGAGNWMSWPLYILWGLVVLLLGFTLLFGDSSNGATRWLNIAGVSIQPSEFAKIAIIMMSAKAFAMYRCREISGVACFLRLVIFVGVPFALIGMGKDLGTLIIVGIPLFAMAFISGVRARWLIATVVVCLLAVVVMILLEPYRVSRFLTFLNYDPTNLEYYYGEGWQGIHGQYGFASGGLFGLGLGESRQKYSWIPEAQNDFILAIVGEELGFVGTFGVIVVFGLFVSAGIRVGMRSQDCERLIVADPSRRTQRNSNIRLTMGWLLACSLSVMMGIQVLLNVAGVTGLLPLSGRTVPFISSGGSSMVASMIIVGLILGVDGDTSKSEREYNEQLRKQVRSKLKVVEGNANGLRTVEGGRPTRPSTRRPRTGRPARGDEEQERNPR